MNGRNPQPPDKLNKSPHQDFGSNEIEIKQESVIKLQPEDASEIVTVSALERTAGGSIVDLIGSGQTGDRYDFTDLRELHKVELDVKKEKIEEEANKNSVEASGPGGIGSPLSKCAEHFRSSPFPCTHCTKRFARKNNLQSHMRSHVSEFLFNCSNCLKEFFYEADKLEHETSCKIRRYKCDLCKEYSTFMKSHLVDHMRVHTGERPFQCDQCDYTTTQKGRLNEHNRMHSGEKPFPCTHCAKRFTQKNHLRSHLRTHVGEFLFSCTNCLKGFSREDEKLEHEISCKIRRYECHLCKEYSTLFKSHFKYHMRVHHTGEKPFGCDRCSKKFPQQSKLKRHLKTHINPRPLKFKCSVCFRNFTQRLKKDEHQAKCKRCGYECYVCKEFNSNWLINLKNHMRIHTGLKPFQCKVCQKLFSQKSYLTKHLKSVHVN